jgi:hypothetical protein
LSPDPKWTREELEAAAFYLKAHRQIIRDGGFGTITVKVKAGKPVEQTASVTYLNK